MAMDNLTSLSIVLDLTVADENVLFSAFCSAARENELSLDHSLLSAVSLIFIFSLNSQHPAKLMISNFFVTQF